MHCSASLLSRLNQEPSKKTGFSFMWEFLSKQMTPPSLSLCNAGFPYFPPKENIFKCSKCSDITFLLFQHLRMSLARQKLLGRLILSGGNGGRPPPTPILEKDPTQSRFFLREFLTQSAFKSPLDLFFTLSKSLQLNSKRDKHFALFGEVSESQRSQLVKIPPGLLAGDAT